MRLIELFGGEPHWSNWIMLRDQPRSDGPFARPLLKGWRLQIQHLGNGVVHMWAWDGDRIVDQAEDYEDTNLRELQRVGAVRPLALREQGLIVPGVNTTSDVAWDEIQRQAKKFGNSVSAKGEPPLNKKIS